MLQCERFNQRETVIPKYGSQTKKTKNTKTSPATTLISNNTGTVCIFLDCSEQNYLNSVPNEQLIKWMPGLFHWLRTTIFLPWFIGRVYALSHIIHLFHISILDCILHTNNWAEFCKQIHKLIRNMLNISLIHNFLLSAVLCCCSQILFLTKMLSSNILMLPRLY